MLWCVSFSVLFSTLKGCRIGKVGHRARVSQFGNKALLGRGPYKKDFWIFELVSRINDRLVPGPACPASRLSQPIITHTIIPIGSF
jgi:hypothetical protein